MDRELVLVALVLLLPGGALLLTGPWPASSARPRSARVMEHLAWRRIWMPLAPAGLLLATLLGWAVIEPEHSEVVPTPLVIVAVLIALIWVRAVHRAIRSATEQSTPVALGTVGLLRPRVVVSLAAQETLGARAIAAARFHEEGHVRSRDPLRLWLAQFASDLQWPWPAARERLLTWRHALEMARDEEARARGADALDLAAAILGAARLGRPMRAVMGLLGDGSRLRERIERLMAPLSPNAAPNRRGRARLAFAGLLVAAPLVGVRLGESVVRVLLR